MYLQDPFTNWANILYLSCTRVVLYMYKISSLYYFFLCVFTEKCHENWSDTFFKKFSWLEFSWYLKNTPFRPAHMSKVPWKKFSWKSVWPVFWNREHKFKSPFCWCHENPMKTDHENYTQDSICVVPNFLWKHFFDISVSFHVISIWKVTKVQIIRTTSLP